MFCFFKQKTAYEMRISDWSSDVCSSDLQRPLRAIDVPARIRAVDRLRAGLMHDIVHSQVLAVGIAVQCRRQQRVVERGVEHPPQSRVAGLDAEIGRATGRERVCQYV